MTMREVANKSPGAKLWASPEILSSPKCMTPRFHITTSPTVTSPQLSPADLFETSNALLQQEGSTSAINESLKYAKPYEVAALLWSIAWACHERFDALWTKDEAKIFQVFPDLPTSSQILFTALYKRRTKKIFKMREILTQIKAKRPQISPNSLHCLLRAGLVGWSMGGKFVTQQDCPEFSEICLDVLGQEQEISISVSRDNIWELSTWPDAIESLNCLTAPELRLLAKRLKLPKRIVQDNHKNLICHLSNYSTESLSMRPNASQATLYEFFKAPPATTGSSRLSVVMKAVKEHLVQNNELLLCLHPGVVSLLNLIFFLGDVTDINVMSPLETVAAIKTLSGFNRVAMVVINRVRYPKYLCTYKVSLFSSRESLECFCHIRDILCKFERAIVEKDLPTIEHFGSLAEAAVLQHVGRLFANSDEISKIDNSSENFLQFIGKEPLERFDHVFLRRLTPEYDLASIAWGSVFFLEQQANYSLAVRRLRLLVFSKLTKHRRAKMFARLVVDLRHLRLNSEALVVAESAVQECDDFGLGDAHDACRRCWKCATLLAKQIAIEAHQPKKKRRRPSPLVSWQSQLGPQTVARIEQSLARELEEKKIIPEILIIGRPLAGTIGHSAFVGFDGEIVSVEQLALEGLRDGGGWNGAHCEGSICRELFGIIFYEILFMEVSDVFQSEFQDSPLDLYTSEFIRPRRDSISSTLERLAAASDVEVYCWIYKNVFEHFGERIVGVSWDFDVRFRVNDIAGGPPPSSPSTCVERSIENEDNLATPPPLTISPRVTPLKSGQIRGTRRDVEESRRRYAGVVGAIGRGMGGKLLAAILGQFVKNFNYWRSGLPDLFLWRSAGSWDFCSKLEIRMVEVKGPGDRLSDKQRQWLLLLAQAGGDVEVCRVAAPPKSECD